MGKKNIFNYATTRPLYSGFTFDTIFLKSFTGQDTF